MEKRSNLKIMLRLVGLVKPLSPVMAAAVILGVAGFCCAIFLTVAGGYGMLTIMGLENTWTVNTLFTTLLLMAVLRGVLHYGEQACNHYIAFKLLALIRDKVFSSLRRLCPAKLEGKDKGNLISVITSDIELLEVFYAHTISPIVIAFIMTVIMTGFMGSFHWILGVLALCGYLTVGILLPLLVSRASGNNGQRSRERAGLLSSFVLESLRGLKEIQQYGNGEERLGKMGQHMDSLAEVEKKMKDISGTGAAVTSAVILLYALAVLGTGAYLMKTGALQFPGVLLAAVAMLGSFGPVVALSNLGSTLQPTFAAANRVLDILDESPVIEEKTDGISCGFTGVDCENLSFAYGREQILKDFSLKIPQNRILGIMGKSGSGKSTLLKLLMRFWDVNEGNIRISGNDIRQINTGPLRDMEGYVTQETFLFHGSIEENLRIAREDATAEEMADACRKASVHQFIESLPQGYQTEVGELGDTLSGGERQRLGIARAFLHAAPLLLLDEPTSNLDSLNEAIILKALDREREDRTVVLVSHRKSTMGIADKVYGLESRRVS